MKSQKEKDKRNDCRQGKERTDDEDEDEGIRMKGSGVRLIRALVIHSRKKLETCARSILSLSRRHLACFFFFIFLIVVQFAFLSKYRALCSGWAQLLLMLPSISMAESWITRLQALASPRACTRTCTLTLALTHTHTCTRCPTPGAVASDPFSP